MKKSFDGEKIIYVVKKYILPVAAIFIFIIGAYYIINQSEPIEVSKLAVTSTSNPTSSWINESEIVVDITNLDSDITEYSFDNGVTWQKSNTFKATTSGLYRIKVKNNKNQISSAFEYILTSVDGEGPKLQIDLPSEILKGTKIDLSAYVTATDTDSGVKGDVTIMPATLDTNSIGAKTITFSAVDNAGNKSTKDVNVTIVEKYTANTNGNGTTNNNSNGNGSNNNSNTVKTYYRYRTKTVNSYACGTYDCGYVDNSKTIAATRTFGTNSACCTGTGCTKRNPQISNPCPPGSYCTMQMVYEYQIKDNICYNANFIYEDVNNGVNIGSSKIKTSCSSGEINIDGYCHTIESTASYTCPSSYTLSGANCVYKVAKTCTNTCTSTTWGEWSNWSTEKQTVTDNMQEQVKSE